MNDKDMQPKNIGSLEGFRKEVAGADIRTLVWGRKDVYEVIETWTMDEQEGSFTTHGVAHDWERLLAERDIIDAELETRGSELAEFYRREDECRIASEAMSTENHPGTFDWA